MLPGYDTMETLDRFASHRMGGDEMLNLGDAIWKWLRQYKRNSVKTATYDRLLTSHKALMNYPVSRIPIRELRSEDLQFYINTLVEEGYALTTIKKQFFLIHAYLNFAATEGIIPRPIQNAVKIPAQSAVKKPKKEIAVYSKDEQDALVRVFATKKRFGYAAAWLMLETGMRVGEALALSWDDVQWNRRAIGINKTIIRIANRNQMLVQKGAKSFTSNRVIPLSTRAYQILEELHEGCKDPCGYIFSVGYGELLTYEALRYQVKMACKDANVPYLGMHVFRHTFATNCYNRGCDVKILSKLLGHADVTVTYNVYIHLYGDALEEMRNVLG